jgi:hypothetical protein
VTAAAAMARAKQQQARHPSKKTWIDMASTSYGGLPGGSGQLSGRGQCDLFPVGAAAAAGPWDSGAHGWVHGAVLCTAMSQQ